MDSFSDLNILEYLGQRGAIGVYKSRDDRGRPGLLRVDRDTPADPRLSPLYREYELLKDVKHRNLARPIFWTVSSGRLGLVYPWIEGADLRTRLERQGPMEPRDAVAAILDIAAGLHCLHSNGLCHLDIKPENVICASGRFVICDYGCLAEIASITPRTELSLPYSAPEVLDPGLGHVGSRSDIWSCGVILWELLHGSMDFPYAPPGSGDADRYSWREAACTFRLDFSAFPDPIARALRGCLSVATEGRFEAAGLSDVLQDFVRPRAAHDGPGGSAGLATGQPSPAGGSPRAATSEKKLPPLKGPRDLEQEFDAMQEEARSGEKDASFYYSLGQLAAEGLWYDQAIKALETAIKFSKRHPPAEQRLAALKLAGRPTDRIVRCRERDCGAEWRLTLEEQKRYLRAGLKPPARCGACRKARREQRSARPWGYVKFYSKARGFGFIVRHDSGGEIFFHIDQWRSEEEPHSGQRVEFAAVQDGRGVHAEQVTPSADEKRGS